MAKVYHRQMSESSRKGLLPGTFWPTVVRSVLLSRTPDSRRLSLSSLTHLRLLNAAAREPSFSRSARLRRDPGLSSSAA
jgi:hypothetical protein